MELDTRRVGHVLDAPRGSVEASRKCALGVAVVGRADGHPLRRMRDPGQPREAALRAVGKRHVGHVPGAPASQARFPGAAATPLQPMLKSTSSPVRGAWLHVLEW